ncbi:PepSY-associated TM helix domain-containing protein [uncultured Duncaniella sp.]|uniref:PepSY-associated TM helix domain-containing protein n=1 Tax=uncultured Duncaniella sp. TaxID=2768039 RepID=UPI00339D350B
MKLFHNIHLWLSVLFGLIITLICFSGAMLIFEPEITRNIKSDIYYVSSSKGDPVPMEKLMETVKATLPDSVSIRYVALNILHATQQAKQKRLMQSSVIKTSIQLKRIPAKIANTVPRNSAVGSRCIMI